MIHAKPLPNVELHSRLERLLREDIRPDDLMSLFLAFRDMSYGRETVVEIGDFVAHRFDRIKGITTKSAYDFFITWNWSWQFLNNGSRVDATRLPSNMRDILTANFRLVPSSKILERTGLKRQDAQKLLDALLTKLTPNGYGGLALMPFPTTTELLLFNFLTACQTAQPAYTEERLFDEFSQVLTKNGFLLHPQDRRNFRRCRPAVMLFIVSMMHRCLVSFGGDAAARLLAANFDGKVSVMAHAQVLGSNGFYNSLIISIPLLVTSLDAKTYLEPDLIVPDKESKDQPDWNFGIELTPKPTLTKIT